MLSGQSEADKGSEGEKTALLTFQRSGVESYHRLFSGWDEFSVLPLRKYAVHLCCSKLASVRQAPLEMVPLS